MFDCDGERLSQEGRREHRLRRRLGEPRLHEELLLPRRRRRRLGARALRRRDRLVARAAVGDVDLVLRAERAAPALRVRDDGVELAEAHLEVVRHEEALGRAVDAAVRVHHAPVHVHAHRVRVEREQRERRRHLGGGRRRRS